MQRGWGGQRNASFPRASHSGASIRADGAVRIIVAGTRMPPLSAISGTSSTPVTKIDSPDPTIGNGDSHPPPRTLPDPHTTTYKGKITQPRSGGNSSRSRNTSSNPTPILPLTSIWMYEQLRRKGNSATLRLVTSPTKNSLKLQSG